MRWDGEGYHRVATVQEAWGIKLLESIPPGRYQRIVDAGCGSGRMTAHLLRMFPRSLVVGLDRSEEMLSQARRVLKRFRRRLKLVHGDLLTAQPGRNFDLIFSNATLHWVHDHARLFRNLYSWLSAGGRFIAQCGGKGNLRRIEAVMPHLADAAPFRAYFRGFRRPVHYGTPAATRQLLERSGFAQIRARLQRAPTRFTSRAAFKDFLRHVICVPDLSRLPTAELRECYLEAFLESYEEKFGGQYVLDYVRLNIQAKRP